MHKNGPIGFFDSGVGGTSIWKEVVSLLPNEKTIYLADSKNAPYGEKSKEEIIYFSKKNTDYLINLGCKLIVVACNTATTNAIDYLRSNYDLPFIGIEPAIKPAAVNSIHKSIGILATKGTLSSRLFAKTSDLYAQNIKVTEIIGTGIVELIEKGELYSSKMRTLLKTYLAPMINENIDYLVLGCSHYPYLLPLLKELLPESITVIDSGKAVAKQTKNILNSNDLLNDKVTTPIHLLYTNAQTEVLKNLISGFPIQKKIEFKNF